MTRDEVLEIIHSHAVMNTFTAGDGHLSIGQSSYKTYLRKFEQGMADLMRNDDLIPADQITPEVYFRYHSQRLWAEKDLLRNPDLKIRREVEYDIAYRGPNPSRKKKDAYWAKWENIELPGDEACR